MCCGLSEGGIKSASLLEYLGYRDLGQLLSVSSCVHCTLQDSEGAVVSDDAIVVPRRLPLVCAVFTARARATACEGDADKDEALATSSACSDELESEAELFMEYDCDHDGPDNPPDFWFDDTDSDSDVTDEEEEAQWSQH
uniref:Uncharacterized protein n=1 Tax=Noctiluca scintillans TaxID=2966 RepID=A0A7S1A2P4_NOCSC|mmetsp:Transcript_29118/g.76907  ORF Transcript_29118/g.76907 Transcript_29118/m.76907 type:complete len:140 (+) Transcript_29118:70-489(+)